MEVTLKVVGKKSNVKRVILKKSTLIGRGKECNLQIVSSQVSRKHCQIDIEDDHVTVRDLGSANGTFVNDSQLMPDQKVTVTPGSTVRLGNVNFDLQYKTDHNDLEFGEVGEEGTTVELAAFKGAKNLSEVKKNIIDTEPEARLQQDRFDEEKTIDISIAEVPEGEPASVILEKVDLELIEPEIIEDVIIDEEEENLLVELPSDASRNDDDEVIELEALEVEPVEQSKEEKIIKVEAAVSEDDIADFLTDLDSSDKSKEGSKSELNNFLDQFE